MVTLLLALVAYVRAFFVSRHKLALEAVALRQQLAVFKRRQPCPKLHRLDRLFWIVLTRLCSDWTETLIIVKPDTIGSWLLCDRTQAADEFSTSTPRRTQRANGSYRNCARLSRGSAVSFVRMLRFEHLAR